MKGWPPKDNRKGSVRGHSVGGKASEGFNPKAERSGEEENPHKGVPATDAFRFPTTSPEPSELGDD